MKQPETILKEKVLADLKTLPNTWHVKVQQTTIRGTPDILACVNGFFVALELKRDNAQRPDKLQDYQLVKIREAGGASFIVHPENWSDIFGYLKEYLHHRLKTIS